jgi:hypothetical protein
MTANGEPDPSGSGLCALCGKNSSSSPQRTQRTQRECLNRRSITSASRSQGFVPSSPRIPNSISAKAESWPLKVVRPRTTRPCRRTPGPSLNSCLRSDLGSPRSRARIRPKRPRTDRKPITWTPKTLTRPPTRAQIIPRWKDIPLPRSILGLTVIQWPQGSKSNVLPVQQQDQKGSSLISYQPN